MLAPSSFMSAFTRLFAPDSRTLIMSSVKDCLEVMMLRLLDNFDSSVLSLVMALSSSAMSWVMVVD